MTGPRKGRRAAALGTGVLAVAVISCGSDAPARDATPRVAANAETAGRIIRLDPRFDELVPAGAELERVAGGFTWVEGPLWNRRSGTLLFSEVPSNTIRSWSPDRGVSTFLEEGGYTGTTPFTGPEPGSNGLAFDAQGRLVICQHGDRRIVRLEADGTRTVLADRYRGKRLNSPNDLVHRSNGDLYFTDPPWGLPQTFDDPAKELTFSGVYRLTPDGELTLLTDDLRAPNGIAFSPDERVLYVSESVPERRVWMAYDVAPDGSLTNGRVLVDAASWGKAAPGNPDGLKVDRAGNVFAAGPGGVHVFAPDGTRLGVIETGVKTGNVGWGEDGSSLFVTAGETLYRIRQATRGGGF